MKILEYSGWTGVWAKACIIIFFTVGYNNITQCLQSCQMNIFEKWVPVVEKVFF